MQKLVVIFVMSLYSVGNILFPNVDMAHLSEMYQHCMVEDPDINIPDFVFEHLLNIPDIFDCLEKDDDKNESPHQPIHWVKVCQVPVVIRSPMSFECRQAIIYHNTVTYPAFRSQHFPAGFSAKMFRPPIV